MIVNGYIAPTAEDIRIFAPELDKVDESVISLAIMQAQLFVDHSWSEKDYPWAIVFLVSHLLRVSGAAEAASNSDSGSSTDDTSTFLSMIAFGERRVQFRAKPSSKETQLAVASGDYDTTPYGNMFLQLRRRNFPAIAVV